MSVFEIFYVSVALSLGGVFVSVVFLLIYAKYEISRHKACSKVERIMVTRDEMTKINLWKRKFKRKFFGETYCTIENQSAHDFQFTGGETFSGIRVLFFECRKCGLNATFDHITGLRS